MAIVAHITLILTILIDTALCFCVKKVEKLDESIVGNLLSRVTELFSLCLHVIVLVIFVVAVISLRQ